MLVLSLFPGIDLLGRAFEEAGFCVVRGPDKLLAQDVRNFHPPPGKFDGVIGGPPCQDFSLLRRDPPTGEGLEMLEQFKRCVLLARPRWWLMENVATVPDVKIDGYTWQRFDLNQGWLDDYSRLRHFQFGSIAKGYYLNVTRRPMNQVKGGAATASDKRTVTELLKIQGLSAEDGEALKAFTVAARKRVIGNGVPLVMGREVVMAVAKLFNCDRMIAEKCDGAGAVFRDSAADNFRVPEINIKRDNPGEESNVNCDPPRRKISWLKRCACQCGRVVTGRHKYSSPACRKRAQRRRDRAAED